MKIRKKIIWNNGVRQSQVHGWQRIGKLHDQWNELKFKAYQNIRQNCNYFNDCASQTPNSRQPVADTTCARLLCGGDYTLCAMLLLRFTNFCCTATIIIIINNNIINRI